MVIAMAMARDAAMSIAKAVLSFRGAFARKKTASRRQAATDQHAQKYTRARVGAVMASTSSQPCS